MRIYPHWEDEDLVKVGQLSSYPELVEHAFTILRKIALRGQPILQVCGPISTGGRGSIQANMEVFGQAIHHLTAQDKSVFDQRPFESPFNKSISRRADDGYPHDLLRDFYQPIFESGQIHELHFLPDWQSSTGAKWEHQIAKSLGLKIIYLPSDWNSK